VKKEDMIFIPAGRIHALGENNLILEVQQNSNTTYRIYDWGREEKNRPLHIKEAISALHWQDKKDPLVERHLTQTAAEFQLYSMLSCKYFALSLLKLKKRVILNLPGKNFIIFFVENGYGDLRYEKHKIKLKPGTTCLLPAHCRNITLSNSTKNLSLVLIAEKTLKKLSVLSG
jgi:mannose-6-phosphate isomerase